MFFASQAISRACSLLAFAAVLATAARPALAQAPDDATRAAARTLGYEGIQDFQSGSYSSAADKLDRAYRALKVPSLGLWSARSLEKLGKLVAASERYAEVQRLDMSSGDVSVQKQARADAETDNAALLPRIPGVIIEVTGAPADEVTVSVNGASVPNSLIGLKRLVDPGSVKVEGQSRGVTTAETVLLKEGETKTVTLRFGEGVAPAAAGAAAGAAPPPRTTTEPADRSDAAPSGNGRRTVGWVALGAGAVGIVVGAVTAGFAMLTRSSTEGCDGTRCPSSAEDDVNRYNTYRTVSSVGFIAGGALAATGAVLILTAPSSSGPKTAARSTTYRLAPWVGVDSVGLALGVER